MSWLIHVTEISIAFLNGLALVMVLAGSVEAIVGVVRLLLAGGPRPERRDVWLGYARWLVAALTFQLGADILESSITHHWEAGARRAAPPPEPTCGRTRPYSAEPVRRTCGSRPAWPLRAGE